MYSSRSRKRVYAQRSRSRTPKTITYNIYIDKHDVPTLGTPIKAQPKADTSEVYDYFKPF